MALPATPTKPAGGKPPEQPQSFASIAASNIKQITTIYGGGLHGIQPWCQAENDNAIIYDLTQSSISAATFRSAARHTFKTEDTCSLIIRKHHRRTIAEVVFNNEHLREQYVGAKVSLPNGQRLSGHRPIPEEWDIVRLNLSNLPAVPPAKLKELLLPTLSPYGHVIDIGIYVEQGWFTGTGYAVLNRSEDPSPLKATATHSPPLPLDHTIQVINEDAKDVTKIHATWARMPLYCKYCHLSGHTKLTCPNKPLPRCYHCQNLGHIQKHCPHRNNTFQPAPAPKPTMPVLSGNKRHRAVSPPPTESSNTTSKSNDTTKALPSILPADNNPDSTHTPDLPPTPTPLDKITLTSTEKPDEHHNSSNRNSSDSDPTSGDFSMDVT